MRHALLILSLLSGCAVDPCSDKSSTCISLEIRAGAGVPSTVRQIGLRMLSGFTFSADGGELLRPAVEKPTSLPAFVALLPPAQFQGGDYSLEVNAYVNGERVGTATAEAAIDLKAKKRLTVTLIGAGTPDDGGAGDDGPPGVCDPVKQTGCGANQKCTANVNDGTLSCVADRTLTFADECSPAGVLPEPATDPCKKGLWCVPDVETGTFSACRQFCASDADCTQGAVIDPDNVGRCRFQLTVGSKARFCSLACDPTTATPSPSADCVSGTACRVVVSGSLEFTNCVGERGNTGEGQPCGGGCEDGLTCFNNVCRKPCLIKSPVCFSGTCTPPFSGAKPYGFCCPGGSC